jgi:hypothetical protein
MKKAATISLAVLFGLTFIVSAAIAAEKIPFSGFLGNPAVYKNLKPGPKDGAKLYWVNPKADLKKYNTIMLDSVVFFLADKAQYKGIDPQDMKELADAFNKELVMSLKDKWDIVADPGPNVLRIRLAITNIQPSNPGTAAVTSVVPVGIGVSIVKKGASGGWVGSGQTGAECMWVDSETNEVVGLAVDQRKAEFEQRFSKWGSANDAFKFWSGRVVSSLENNLKIPKKEPQK